MSEGNLGQNQVAIFKALIKQPAPFGVEQVNLWVGYSAVSGT